MTLSQCHTVSVTVTVRPAGVSGNAC